MDEQGKANDENMLKAFLPMFLALIVSMIIAFFWQHYSFIKETAHMVLDPTAGALLNWNLTWGMTVLIFILTLFTTLVQKYATDQKTLKELKEQQRLLREEEKKVINNPEKVMALQKEGIKLAMPIMKLSMRPVAYTAIPFFLFIRWFLDYFASYSDFRFLGFLSWFWFYLLGSIIFSSILRKVLKVA